MDLMEIFLVLSIVLTAICAVIAAAIFVYDFLIAMGGSLVGGGDDHKWSKAPLLFGLGAILFFILSIVGVFAG